MPDTERPAVAPGTSDILGQEQPCGQLWKALAAGRLHHCYLFEGPRGVGKATVALRLAMAANCEASGAVGALPCGTCGPCRLVAEGRHPDVIEVTPDPEKATRVITVDQAREVIRRLSLHRHSARRRFVIVDPVDLLRVEAVNALLKTLEEPPAETGFILVTSRAALLLPTVISRSLRVRFRPVPPALLGPWLERRGVEEAGRLARLSMGSPGVALELAAGEADALTQARDELVAAVSADPATLFRFTEQVTAPPREAWEKRVERVLTVLEILMRDVSALAAGREEDLLDPGGVEVTRAWARRLWPGGVRALEEAMETARRRLDVNVTPRLVLEALLARLATEIR